MRNAFKSLANNKTGKAAPNLLVIPAFRKRENSGVLGEVQSPIEISNKSWRKKKKSKKEAGECKITVLISIGNTFLSNDRSAPISVTSERVRRKREKGREKRTHQKT